MIAHVRHSFINENLLKMTTETDRPWLKRNWVQHSQLLLDSYKLYLGEDLISREGNAEAQAQRLFESDFVVVSHDKRPDPILNYGNRTALNLWQMEIRTFCETPSRYTAEPVHRDERKRLLQRTAKNGFVDDYSGIRISSTGQRFFIPKAIVWNLVDFKNNYRGQAATFSDWKMLEPESNVE